MNAYKLAAAQLIGTFVIALVAAQQTPSGTPTPQPANAAAARLIVSNLKADANPSPLGIDNAKPALTWQLSEPGRGIAQLRYRLLVASTSALVAARKGDLWDTGPVSSDNTSVTYAGKPLASRTRYYWTVEVTTKSTSAWAPTAWFETAYLTPAEWQGVWISGPPRATAILTAAQGAADDSCCIAFQTTLHESAPAGTTNVRLANTSAIAPGLRFTIGSQTVTVTDVGTAASTTTLAAPAEPGATNIKVAGVTGLQAGEPILIGSHHATMTDVGRPAINGTLSATVSEGATEIQVVLSGGRGFGGNQGIQAGDTVIVDGESRAVVSVVAPQGGRGRGGPGGPPTGAPGGGGRGFQAQPTSVTIVPALTSAHVAGGAVVGLGTGITFSPALPSALPQGTPYPIPEPA